MSESLGFSKSGALLNVTTPVMEIPKRLLSVPEIEYVIVFPSGSSALTVKADVWFSRTLMLKTVLLIFGGLFVLVFPPP